MATTKALERQPDKLDYASPTQFSFIINQLPKVQFFTTACNLPGITLGTTTLASRFKQVPIQGDNVDFASFELSFIVDEYLENYLSLHNWITAAGFPKSTEQFRVFRDETAETSDLGYEKAGTSSGMSTKSDRNMTSDSTLTILSNKNNPIVEVRFRDMFPTTLSALDYDQSATDVEYMKASATFEYQLYEIVKI